VAYSGEAQQQNDVAAHRRGSCEFHGAIGSELPPKPPASRRFSMDSTTRAQVRPDWKSYSILQSCSKCCLVHVIVPGPA
jgi:hypothetical protein